MGFDGRVHEYIGSYALALVLIFFLGLFSSVYMISIMSTLQMLVPNEMRGRVMGFYGMTWNIMPLGGMFAGALGLYRSVVGCGDWRDRGIRVRHRSGVAER
jgi:MFS family permease